jgi:hypothetical protein
MIDEYTLAPTMLCQENSTCTGLYFSSLKQATIVNVTDMTHNNASPQKCLYSCKLLTRCAACSLPVQIEEPFASLPLEDFVRVRNYMGVLGPATGGGDPIYIYY